jgi:hypothetical protein
VIRALSELITYSLQHGDPFTKHDGQSLTTAEQHTRNLYKQQLPSQIVAAASSSTNENTSTQQSMEDGMVSAPKLSQRLVRPPSVPLALLLADLCQHNPLVISPAVAHSKSPNVLGAKSMTTKKRRGQMDTGWLQPLLMMSFGDKLRVIMNEWIHVRQHSGMTQQVDALTQIIEHHLSPRTFASLYSALSLNAFKVDIVSPAVIINAIQATYQPKSKQKVLTTTTAARKKGKKDNEFEMYEEFLQHGNRNTTPARLIPTMK